MSLLSDVKKKGSSGFSLSKPAGTSLLSRYVKPKTEVAPVVQPQQTFVQKAQGFLGEVANKFGKFAAKVDIAGANLVAQTVDFSVDFLANTFDKVVRGENVTNKFSAPNTGILPETDFGKKIADRWKNFYNTNVGSQTENFKKVVDNLNKLPAVQPSKEWSQASLKQKFSPKFLPETVLETGPGVLASLGSFAINPALGFSLSVGSVADEINTMAKEAGLDEDTSLSLGLGTGLLVGYLDKIVPEEILNPEEKKMMIGALAKKVLASSLKEGATEMTQEAMQLLVESTLRNDLGFDEVKNRVVMSGFGGFLGGSTMQGVVSFANNVISGDIGGVQESDVKNPQVFNDVLGEQVDQKVTTPETQQQVVTETQKSETTPQELQQNVTQEEYDTLLSDSSKINRRAIDAWTSGENIGANRFRIVNEYLATKGLKLGRPGEPIVRVSQTESQLKQEAAVKTSTQEIAAISEEKIKNVSDIKSAKSTLKSIQVELDQAVTEAQGRSTVAQMQREGLDTRDIATLKRIYSSSNTFKEGDVETMRAKHGDLVNRVLQNVQEVNPGITGDQEAFQFALNLPTAADEKTTTPQISELRKKEKQLSKYLDLLKTHQNELNIKEDTALSKEWERALVAQEQLQQVVKVPSSQLPVGEGKQKVSRLEARLKGALDMADQTQIDELGLSKYKQMNQQDQISQAVEYVKNNQEEALKVLSGEVEPPKGLLQNSIYAALVELGREDTDLATKITTLSATRLGQEINILKTIMADNPVVMMQDIVQARIEAYEKNTRKKVSKVISEETQKISENIKATSKEQWNSFIASIRC